MDEVRKGQLACMVLKYKLRKDGIRLTPALQREIANGAKSLGISKDEAIEFLEIIIRELVDETFATSKQS